MHPHNKAATSRVCLCMCRLSLLRYNTNLTRYKNLLFSQSQQLRAKLAIFKTSIQNDLEQYTRQRHVGICEWMLISCWDTIESDVMKPLVNSLVFF